MNIGKALFAQVMDFLPWSTFRRIVARYGGDRRVRTLTCAEQYRAMAFAQLTYRESLRDIETCLSAQSAKLYHMGFREPVRRSTLADANEMRDWRIYAELALREALLRPRRDGEPDQGVPARSLCRSHLDRHDARQPAAPVVASFAYILLCAVRRIGLHHTPFANASCGTIRLKLLKIGALVRVRVRRIKIAMASSCPAAEVWGCAAVRLIAAANARGSPA
jgi:hypothetical protein